MDRLRKIQSGIATAGGRIRSAPGAAWGKVRSGGVRAGGRIHDTAGSARDGAAELWERTGVPRLADGARSNPRVAIAWAAAAILVLAWIGWAIYVSSENGSRAGLGVLISWPVAVAAVALVASPFVGAWLLVKRLRPRDDGPTIAGGAPSPERAAEAEQLTGGTYPG